MSQYPLKPETIECVRQVVVRAGYEFDGIQDSLDPARLREIIFQTTQDRYIFSVPFDPDNFDDSHLTKSLQHEVAKYRRGTEKKMTLLQKLHSVYGTLLAIEKQGRNTGQNYDYVRAADVTNAIRKELFSVKVYAEINQDFVGSPYTIARAKDKDAPFTAVNVRCSIVFHDLESKETITASGVGSGADTGDKAAYKAMTGALKYALKNAFLVPDEMDPEADAALDENARSRGDAHQAPANVIYPAAQQTKPSSDTHLVQLSAPEKTAEVPLPEPAPVVQGDAYEEPVENVLPTEEQLVAYRAKFRTLGDELSAKGKLTANRNLPLTRKLLVFLLSTTQAPDANNISVTQWDDFFARAEAVAARENGLIELAKMVNKVNGIEPKEK